MKSTPDHVLGRQNPPKWTSKPERGTKILRDLDETRLRSDCDATARRGEARSSEVMRRNERHQAKSGPRRGSGKTLGGVYPAYKEGSARENPSIPCLPLREVNSETTEKRLRNDCDAAARRGQMRSCDIFSDCAAQVHLLQI